MHPPEDWPESPLTAKRGFLKLPQPRTKVCEVRSAVPRRGDGSGKTGERRVNQKVKLHAVQVLL